MSSSLPLAGRRILVTRPEAQAEALCDAISAAGGQPLRFPLLDIVAAPDAMLVDGTAVKIAAQGALVIFVSPNAVRHGLPHFLPWPAAARAAAIGAGTARALSDADIPDVLLPADHTHFDSEGLLALPELAMKTIAGRKILIVRGNGGRELLQEILHTRGAAVIPLTAYRRTAPAPERLADLRKTLVTSPVDALTLSSSEMVASLAALFSGEGQLKVAENLCAYLQTRHCEARSAVAIQRAQSALAGALDCHGPAALAMTKWEKLTQRLVFHADEISSTSNRLLPDAQDFYARFVQHVLFDRPLFVTHPRIAEAARVAGFTRVVQTATSDAGLLLGLCAYNWPPS